MKPYWPAAAFLVAGMAITAGVFHFEWRCESARLQAEWTLRTELDRRALQAALGDQENLVEAIRSDVQERVATSGEPRLGAAVAGLMERHPGIVAVACASRVTAAERPGFEAKLRGGRIPGFRIIEPGPAGPAIPAVPRAESFPVVEVVPTDGGRAMLGLDLGSAHRDLLDSARDRGRVTASGPVPVPMPMSAGGGPSVLLLVAPIYRSAGVPETVERRRAGLTAFVVVAFSVPAMIEEMIERASIGRGMDFYFFDRPAAGAGPIFHVHRARSSPPGRSPTAYGSLPRRLHFATTLEFAGRGWAMVCSPLPQLYPEDPGDTASEILMLGLGGTLVTAISVLVWINRLVVLRYMSRVQRATSDALAREVAEHKLAERWLSFATTIVENSPTMLAHFRIAGPPDDPILGPPDYISANIRSLGYGPDDYLSGRVDFFRDIVHAQDRRRVVSVIVDAIRAGNPEAAAEFRVATSGGAVRWEAGRMRFERDASGRVVYAQALINDITELKEAERELRRLNAVLSAQFEGSPEGILVLDDRGQISAVNRRFVEMWSLAPEVVEAKDAARAMASVAPQLKDSRAFLDHIHDAIAHPEQEFWDVVELEDGRLLEQTSSRSHPLGDGRGWTIFSRDITARRRAEEALRASERRFRAVAEAAQDAIITIDSAGHVRYWNRAAETILGYSEEEAIGRVIHQWLAPGRFRKAAAEGMAAFARAADGSAIRKVLELAAIRKDGVEIPIELSIATLELEGERFAVGILRDITARKQAEEALRESERRLRVVFDSINDVLILHHPDGTFAEVNSRVVEMFGYSPGEFLGLDFGKLSSGEPPYTPADCGPMLEKARGGEPQTFEWHARAGDGRLFWIEVSLRKATLGGRDVLLSVARDITERKRAEDDLRYRDSILHSIMVGANAILTATTLAEAMPRVLETVARAVGVDRVVVVELRRDRGGSPVPSLTSVWQSADVPPFLPEMMAKYPPDDPDILEWQAPIRAGRPMEVTAREVKGVVREIFRDLGTVSMLRVPIFIDGTLWGFVGVHDCRSEREWKPAELDTLITLADLIGSAVVRERYIQAMANADKIVRNSTTILVRLEAEAGYPFLLSYISPNIARVGRPASEFLGDPLNYREMIHPDDQARTQDLMMGMLAPEAAADDLEFRWLDGSNAYRWFSGHFTPIRDDRGTLKQVEAVVHDITDHKEAEAVILRLARNDVLTGLSNRAVFVEALEQAEARARRGGKPFAVLYIDLDHFKDVNDTLGHPAGDALLQEVADRLRGRVRETDTVARFGGDEFAILQSDLESVSEAGVLAGDLLEVLTTPLMIAGNQIRIGASVGIALYGEDAPDPEALLSHADVALYRAKKEGRSTFRFFTEAMDAEVRSQVTLLAELRDAVATGQFFLLYQPQVDTESGRLIGLESLVRWRHPTRGVVLPSEFIPAAEQGGLILTLGRWVLRAACRQARAWLDAGIAPPLLSVNVSAIQFRASGEVEREVSAILAETGLPPSLLELELTEAGIMEAWRDHRQTLDAIHRMGLRIAIDDFGTGYSSLDYLRRLPVDRLKIAPSFVSRITDSPGEAAIVKATIGLAHDLEMDLIAEGVETEEQARLLESWDCRHAQGYLFARPMAPDDLTPLLRRGGVARPGCVGAR